MYTGRQVVDPIHWEAGGGPCILGGWWWAVYTGRQVLDPVH